MYGLRQVVLLVRANKVILDYAAGRRSLEARFADLLARNYQYETQGFEDSYVLGRVLKIRELYRIHSPHTKQPESSKLQKKPQVCVVELASLLDSLGRHLEIRKDVATDTLMANDLLALIANHGDQRDPGAVLSKEKDVEAWFIQRPISVEQVCELLIAAVYALVFRSRSDSGQVYIETKRDESSAPAEVSTLSEHLRSILELEAELRQFVALRLLDAYPAAGKAVGRLKKHLGTDEFQKIEERARRSTGHPVSELEALDFTFLMQVAKIIYAEWNHFHDYFPDKRWLQDRLEKIVAVRNESAHARPVSITEQRLAMAYCSEVGDRVRNYRSTAES